MATIDSFFKPKLHRPKESQGALHLSLMNEVGQSAVNGKDSNQNSKLTKTVSLDDSLDEFESSTKNLTPKTKTVAKVSKKSFSGKADPSNEKKVVEISYADFLKGSSNKTNVGKVGKAEDITSEAVGAQKNCEPDSSKEQLKAEKKEKKVEISQEKSAESIQSNTKPRSAFDLLKWNNKKCSLLTSDSLQSDTEETEKLEALPTKPTKGVTSFFKKVDKSEAFLKAKTLVEAKAEVYMINSPERSNSPCVGSLKKRHAFRKSNVAVVDDSDITQIEILPENIHTETKVELKHKLEEDFYDDCVESNEEICLGEVNEHEAEKDDMQKVKERTERVPVDTKEKVVLGENTDYLKNWESVGKADLENEEAEDVREEEDMVKLDEKDGEISEKESKTEEENEKAKEGIDIEKDQYPKVEHDCKTEQEPSEDHDSINKEKDDSKTDIKTNNDNDKMEISLDEESIDVVHLSDEERNIPSPVVFLDNEALKKSVVEIVSDDEKLQKKSRVTLTRTDSNKMQSTLSFGAKGISIKRPVKTPKKVTRMRDASDDDFQSPEEKTLRRSLRSPKKVVKSLSVRRSARFQERSSEDEVEENFDQVSVPEKPDKEVNLATVVPPRKGKKKTPLKIRFTRSGSDSNAEESPVHRKDAKISRAQELVKKAKEKRVKQILQTQGSQELRRSCRRSAHVASQSISLTMEETVIRRPKRKPVDVEADPPPKKMPPKATGKLAPIFQLKAKSQPPTVILSDDEQEIKVILTEEEKEKQRMKKAFLFSAIPNAVKKHAAEITMPSDLPYPPFPSVSHVQQITGKESPWCLPKDVSLPLALKSPEMASNIVPACTTPGVLTYCCKTSSPAEACPTKNKFSPDSLKCLLAEVKTSNAAFPVNKCFRQLQKLVESPLAEVPNENGKKSKDVRRKSRRGVKRNRDPEEMDTKLASKAVTEQSLQWTDKLAPNHSSDFFSNTKAVKRLHSWLSEWKHRTDVDLKKAMRAEILKARRSGKSMDEIRKKYADALWTDDLDDFNVSGESDSDPDEKDDSLCNTMLVQGPHGCGKSAMVYALAQELGYKVFEVNASQKRSGRQIISELQEATQSHQVSTQKTTSAPITPVTATAAKTLVKAKPEKGKKKSNAFSNFFAKKSDVANSPVVHQTKKTKVKDEAVDANIDVSKKVKLSGVSLILFEEADVVLEEDRGFWSAVQTFIQTTKRPILLTATDINLADKLTCRMETLHLKAPSSNHLASYLQLVCLLEGVRTSHDDLMAVASLFKCDIRRSLLSLQFWVQSGIHSRCPLPVTYNRKHLRIEEKKTQTAKLLENHAPSDDEFEIAPRKRRRKCRTILDEDSGPEIPYVLPNEDSQSSIPEFLPFSPDVRETDTIELSDATHVHRLFLESLCNVAEFTGPHTAVQCLRSKSKDALVAISVASAFRQFSVNLVHSNLLSFLPLKRAVSNFSYLRLTTPAIKPGSRISNANDLFDSEESEDGFPSLKSNSRDSFEPEKIEILTGSNTDEKLQKMIMAINDESFDEKPGKRYVARSLHSMASIYDTLSFTDTLSTHASSDRWTFGRVTSGDLDHVTLSDDSDWFNQQFANEIASTIEVLQLRRTNIKLKKLKDKICKYSPEEIEIPVDRLNDCVNSQQEPSVQISSAEATAKAGLRVRDNLPASAWCDHRSLALDYLPMLRFVCRSEQLRATIGRKRRFLHYLDPLIRELRESVISTLCSAF